MSRSGFGLFSRVLISALVGLVVSTGTVTPARADCHAPERPALGLDVAWDQAGVAARRVEAEFAPIVPAFARTPCNDGHVPVPTPRVSSPASPALLTTTAVLASPSVSLWPTAQLFLVVREPSERLDRPPRRTS